MCVLTQITHHWVERQCNHRIDKVITLTSFLSSFTRMESDNCGEMNVRKRDVTINENRTVLHWCLTASISIRRRKYRQPSWTSGNMHPSLFDVSSPVIFFYCKFCYYTTSASISTAILLILCLLTAYYVVFLCNFSTYMLLCIFCEYKWCSD